MSNLSKGVRSRIWSLQTQIGKGILDGTHDPEKFTELLQDFLENKGGKKRCVSRKAEMIGASGYEDLLAEWSRFYKEVFGIEADFTDLQIPEKQDGFNWLIVMLAGLTPNKLFAKCEERFASWCYTYDIETIKSVRTADKTYAVWVRDNIEADKENKNKSANDCDKEGIKGITLEERLLLELFYHWRTGKHLDSINVTLCSGSRYPYGHVPNVCWHGLKVHVNYYAPDYCYECLRARSVSL